jgi:hypothetical protein
MRTDVFFPSTVLSKLIEIVGAGLASAVGAFLLGQIAKPATPPPPVVKIRSADAGTIRTVRSNAAEAGLISGQVTVTRASVDRFKQSAM